VEEHRQRVVLSLPLIAFVVFFVRRFVVMPLTEMNRSLAEIAKGEGDLTRRLAVAGRDEIGQTAATFNAMLGTIAQLVRQVRGRAGDRFGPPAVGGRRRVADGSRRQNEQSEHAAASVEDGGQYRQCGGQRRAVHLRSGEPASRGRGQPDPRSLVSEVGHAEDAVRQMAIRSSSSSSRRRHHHHDAEVRDRRADQPAGAQCGHRGCPCRRAGRGFAVADEGASWPKSRPARPARSTASPPLGRQSVAVGAAVHPRGSIICRQPAPWVRSNAICLPTNRCARSGMASTRLPKPTEQRTASAAMAASIEAIAAMTRDNTPPSSRRRCAPAIGEPGLSFAADGRAFPAERGAGRSGISVGWGRTR
jgi:methyl-accepting chemotaxis protein